MRAKAAVVELRFFGGLSVEETAEVLQVSPTTVLREWRTAKAWLHRELSAAGGASRIDMTQEEWKQIDELFPGCAE
jgi:DNA-directed RNA polymerase specialized sigma24 family protein